MPKTNFVDGVTTVAAAFLNKIFDHNHLGLDEDGSNPKIDLATEALLDTAGQPLKSANAPVAWIAFEAGTGTVIGHYNVDVANSSLTIQQPVVRLLEPVRSDLDVSGGQEFAGAAIVTTSASAIIASANYYRSPNGSNDIEQAAISFHDVDGLLVSAQGGSLVSLTLFASYPNGIG